MDELRRTVAVVARWYNGTRVKNLRTVAFALYGDICHLCGYPGSDTVDHLIPTSVAPWRTWDVRNVRPAHRYCNYRRKTKPLPDRYIEAGWLR